MLKGEAKKNYQREYMRKRRVVRPDVRPIDNVRPLLDPIRPAVVRPTKDIIKELQAKIDNVRPRELETKKEVCLQCKAFGKHTEATQQTEIITDNGVRTAWLCDRCNSKISVY